MFNRILASLDCSPLAECVLPHAIALARIFDAQVALLHVLAHTDPQAQARAVDVLAWQLRRAEAERYLYDVCTRLQEAGVACTTHVIDGEVASQLVDFVGDNAIDLVLLASHGQGGPSEWRVGSIAHKVIARIGAASLMLVRALEPTATDSATADSIAVHYRRVLAPLDGSARAESILPLAAALARMPDTEIVLVHGVERPAMPRRTPLSREEIDLVERLVDRNYVEAEHYLETVRTQLPSDAVKTAVLVSDHVADSLRALVEQERIDLVILSAHGYSGQLQWPFGGLVASFVARGTRPLIIFQDAPGEQARAASRREGTR